MKLIYYIGGSPCSGKSTVSEAISQKYNLHYFKVDDFLDELQFYHEIFEFIIEDINNLSNQNGIITEGAAFLPYLMKSHNIDYKHYINITPTPEFQIFHYTQSSWISHVLEGCSDKEKAFMNWMNRDILFADAVRKQCEEIGYPYFITDGTSSAEELFKNVCLHFDMEG